MHPSRLAEIRLLSVYHADRDSRRAILDLLEHLERVENLLAASRAEVDRLDQVVLLYYLGELSW